MKIEIHHYHHLAAEDSKMLSQIIYILLPVERKLDSITETLKVMANQEQELNTGISDLRDVTVDGFKSINEAVDKATQRVIQKLEAKDIDLADEISDLREMKTIVRQSSDSTVNLLGKIASGDELETPPIGEPANGTTEALPADQSEPETNGEQTTEANAPTVGGEQPADVNQPFEPERTEDTTGWDDQERTPVPQK